jgi:hypothetical protein
MHNIACLDCSVIHRLPPNSRQALASAQGFVERHPLHDFAFDIITATEIHSGHVPDWAENADVKLAYQAAQAMTVTSLHSLASSATAGWQSAVVDNTTNLFLDALGMVVLDFANTAPANSKAAFVYGYGGLESGTYTNPASGTEGALTLLDVTANPNVLKHLYTLAYGTADEVAEGAPFSVAAGFGGVLPPFWGLAIINHSGAALAASGNILKYRGVYATVI